MAEGSLVGARSKEQDPFHFLFFFHDIVVHPLKDHHFLSTSLTQNYQHAVCLVG